MKKNIIPIVLLIVVIMCFSGCSTDDRPTIEDPVVLNMWHVYGSQTQSPLNDAIDEFNRTLGKENGITVNVISVTSSSAIDQALAASVNEEPGSESLPDLFTAYPRVVEIVGEENLLSWDQYFDKDELSQFNQVFLDEGYFHDYLLMLPIAKSSEAFYVNKTIFDQFSKNTNVSIHDLTSFDQIFAVAKKYYDWSDGQNFMQINDYYHYAYVGMKTFGKDFIKEGKLQLDEPVFKQIWLPLAKCAIYGGICLDDGYAASRWKTVEIIANTGSTADVLYQPEEIIYSDNTTKSIESVALPYPLFDKSKPGAVHRGGGIFALKNKDEKKNYAAYLFAKWITEKEQNLNFVTQAGYIPVKTEAFDALFTDIQNIENEKFHNLYEAVSTMTDQYELYALPVYPNASEIQNSFENNVKTVLKSYHNQYIKQINQAADPDALLDDMAASSMMDLIELSSK